jgi:chondroitin synthase
MNNTNVLNEAIGNYKKKNYEKALELFEQAGERYGTQIVAANIRLCKKAIAARPQQKPTNNVTPGNLDPATVLLLAYGGEIAINEAEKQSCLARYQEATRHKSEDAEVRVVNPTPSDWPKDLVLAPLPESTNDFIWHRKRKSANGVGTKPAAAAGLSIVIPTFNRNKILDVTLACLVNQKTNHPFEVIVACDGSKEAIVEVVKKYEPELDIKYVRQKDYGYQLCAVRNLGLRTAKYEFVAILDCDMAPNPFWVQSYVDLLNEDDDVALIGPRKYVDTSTHSADDFLSDPKLIETLPQVATNNDTAGKFENTISVDWRLDHFKQTDNLRLCDTPFRYFSGGNVAFAKKWLDRAGWFDEEFTHWGGEDNEFGYRLYRQGCFFRAADGAMAYHQEPPGKENETDRAEGKKITINIVREKVPYYYRKLSPVTSTHIHKAPLVSIYIPAYNCADHIVKCVDSALNQTVVDLQVCICDDGSTDDTLEVLEQNYGANPRVRIATKRNGGIGSASNAAVKMARGYYIGQLDSDDYLEPDAVELCLKEFFADRKLACVYTTNRNVRPDGSLIANGYNWPVFSREKLTTAMIVHHFRMFTARAWHLTEGFDEAIVNAVDYDMYLKLSEVGPFKHVNKTSYNRVLHGENTSIKKLGIQKKNHFYSVNQSLKRQDLNSYVCLSKNSDSDQDRQYTFDKVLG